jgi:hypothetical protein
MVDGCSLPVAQGGSSFQIQIRNPISKKWRQDAATTAARMGALQYHSRMVQTLNELHERYKLNELYERYKLNELYERYKPDYYRFVTY